MDKSPELLTIVKYTTTFDNNTTKLEQNNNF